MKSFFEGKSLFSSACICENPRPILVLVLILFIACLPYPALAAGDNLEKEIQAGLEQSRAIILTIQNKLQAGGPIAVETAKLKTAAENIRISHLLLEERFKLREEKAKGLGSKATERHQAMAEGYRKALTEYLSIIDGLPSEVAAGFSLRRSQESIDNLKTLLDKIVPKRKRSIIGSLPYKHLNYPAIEPSTAPTITPAYKGGNKTVSPDDTKSTEEAPISKEIAALAQSLNWQPVSIYEYVKNNIETEWYWGCQKGAEETLRQKSGNDCDQALLLSSLLKASGFPTRLVRGTIEFFPNIERVKHLIGIDDPAKIAEFFQKAGIPYKPVIAGGRISNFQIEHIWVESRIPYANYRGLVIDEYGKVWLGLDTSIKIKGYTYNNPQDILQQSGISGQLSAIRDSYLGLSSSATGTTALELNQTPLEYLQSYINAQLISSQPTTTYTDFLLTRTLIPEVLHILPATPQFTLVKATNEYTALPDELKHKVKLSAVSAQQLAVGNQLYEITLDTMKLSNKQIAITYEPETVQDQEIIDSYGGLDNTPSYLVRLRPVLKINNERIIVAQDGLPMGADYNLTIELYSPSVNGGATPAEKITNTLITGNLSVIGIVAQKAVSNQQSADSSKLNAESLLFQAANHYIDRWNRAEEELASLLHLTIVRPLPTVVTVGGVIDVSYLLDIPHGFTWKGVYVDADHRSIETVTRTQSTDDRQKLFMQLSSLQGSVLENRIFEDDFKVESISTAKLFQLATGNAQPVTILTIDKSNVAAVLPTLPYDDDIKADIENSMNQNLIIKIPSQELTYENWGGTGFIKENAETGEAGYMLSGSIAGGMTAWDISRWNDIIAGTLQTPYSEPANYDPASARYIQKMAASDMQDGTVGTVLAKPLQVQVLDQNKKAVKNVIVTFTVKAGGGTLTSGVVTGPTVTATTNNLGIASVTLTLGKYTKDNPTFVWDTGYTYSQQAGENIVDASLPSGVNLTVPFTAIGFPKDADHMTPTYGNNTWGLVLSFAGFVSVAVADIYDNPISNIPVTFTATDPTQNPNIPNCPWTAQDSHKTYLTETGLPCIKNSPVWGTCGDPLKSSLTVTTDHTGAAAQVILGGMEDAIYTLKATALTFNAEFKLYTYDSYLSGRPCDGASDPLRQLFVTYTYSADQYGNNINAGKTDTAIPVHARLYYIVEQETEKDVSLNCGNGTLNCSKVVGTRQYDIKTIFKNELLTFSGAAGMTFGGGIYTGNYTLKPGLNTITINGSATIDVRKTNMGCPDTCKTVTEPLTKTGTATMTVYGVDITTASIPLILVNNNGYASKDTVITYTIAPADYQAYTAYVMIYKDGNVVAQIPAETKGAGTATISRGFQFDANSKYEAEVILNYGTGVEIKSDRVTIPVAQIWVMNDEEGISVVDEIRYGDGSKPEKRYHLELKSAALAKTCSSLIGKISIVSSQTVTLPTDGAAYSAEYPLQFGATCNTTLIDTLDNGSTKGKFIISNRSRAALSEETSADLSNKAVLYGGIGNKVQIEINGAKEILPIEPVGVIVLGIDGLRQDVLYPDALDKVQDGGQYRVNIGDLPGLKQILSGYDQPEAKQRYNMLPEVTAIFPSITLASWASIFTGVQAGQTGILGNEFFDRATGQMITFSDGAFPMMDMRKRYPIFPKQGSGKGEADKQLNGSIQTVYEALSPIKTSHSELKTVTVMHNYSRGADEWIYFDGLIDGLRLWWNAKVRHDEKDIARLMDSSPVNDTVTYINNIATEKKKFPILFSVYLAGLDHWAHDEGMNTYVQFFKDNSDKGIEKIVKALKDAGEFDNKIFIIVADHGHTVMPTDLTFKAAFKTVDENGYFYREEKQFPAEMSCKLNLDFSGPLDPEQPNLYKLAEQANNNLHIWELGEVFKAVGSIQNTVVRNKYKVLAPIEIANIFLDDNGNDLPAGATSKTENAHIIAALNGPMAHIYVQGVATGQVAEMLSLMLQMEDADGALQWLGLEELDYKQIRETVVGRMKSSIDKILIRISGNYCVFDGLNDDDTASCAVGDPFATGEYVDAWTRINGMNHPDRSGDIVLIMRDATSGSALDRYTTGVACKSWHGSLSSSDSYVPFIVSYPGGNKAEMEKILQKGTLCKTDYSNCKGNWKLSDIVKGIISEEYR